MGPIPRRPHRVRSLASVLVTVAGLALTIGLGQGSAAADDGLQCGDTVTHDVRLTHDLKGCDDIGLVVGAHGVTIDLDGHSITSPGLADISVGIEDGDGYDGLRVEDGTIKGFGAGIYTARADHVTVRSMRISDARDAAILVDESSHGSITGNRVSRVVSRGISVYASRGYVVSGNTVTTSGQGIGLIGATHSRVVGNTLSDNNFGVAIDESNGNRIERNVIRRSAFSGVWVVDRSDRNKILRNLSTGNPGSGVYIEASSAGTLVRGNRVSHNGYAPPKCAPDCPTLDDGINTESPDSVLAGNLATANADLGIQAVDAVEDRGGNRAHGNGDARECTGISCRP